MTLADALTVFDEVRLHPDYPDQPGEARCCGLPVVMNSQNGVERIFCLKCNRGIRKLKIRWIVEGWGDRP